MGALGIERSAGMCLSILQQRVAALRRYNRIAFNVQRGREESSTEIPQPAGDSVRDPAAGAGMGVDPASRFRRAAFFPPRRVASLPPRYEPCVRARLRAREGPLPPAAGGEARPDRFHLGLSASLLRRYPIPLARSQ